MSDSTHKTLLEAANEVNDPATARAFIDAIFNDGISWHPEESFTEIVNHETGEATFTAAEAKELDAAVERTREVLPGNEIYDYSLARLRELPPARRPTTRAWPPSRASGTHPTPG